MAGDIRAIKDRIRSVANTSKVTRAQRCAVQLSGLFSRALMPTG